MMVVTKLERLREVAMDQHGFVTTAQAIDEGVLHAELSAMVARKRITRVAHGVYRIPQVPETEHDQYQLAVLWTGVPEACLSHDTALDAWGISDINPERIHVSVGRHRRLRRQGGARYTIHYVDLSPQEMTWWQGIRIVTLPTAIQQSIASGVPTYLIRQALDRAGSTGALMAVVRDKQSRELEVRDQQTWPYEPARRSEYSRSKDQSA
jgi:predicted transcriptional regulator of viral defense system